MTHQEIRAKFLDFFEKRGHKIVPSSSLIADDGSVLFTTAGMQQFKLYFTGQADPVKDFGSKRTASIQKSMRTSDIDEVGDESHLTFFEMLGHFSFGDYFKKETIRWTYEFLTEELDIDKGRISATVFAGDEKIPFDSESYDAWAKFIPQENIKKGSREDNVWGPAGPEGPCGAANEVYVDGLEVATLVFMEYFCGKDGDLAPLPQKGVDVGWGFERITMISQGRSNIFETDLLQPLLEKTPTDMEDKVRRIITDHSRAIVFLISDSITPSNKEQGYILRRLIRRVMTYSYLYLISKRQKDMEFFNYENVLEAVYDNYKNIYENLDLNKIRGVISLEYTRFSNALSQGTTELKKFFGKFISGVDPQNPGKSIIKDNLIIGQGWGIELFRIYQSNGLHPDIAKDILEQWGLILHPDIVKEYETVIEQEKLKHQEKSRAGAEKKFGGHGLITDTGELKAGNEVELKKATRLHTAAHLLHAALRKILGDEVKQRGSDITTERLRFDFSFPRKMTSEEIKETEDMVNEAINKNLAVTKEEMSYDEAIKSGALAFFKHKYPETVSVYTINGFSKELCGGPHVQNTLEIGRFKIKKEESASAGIRRIRAVVE